MQRWDFWIFFLPSEDFIFFLTIKHYPLCSQYFFFLLHSDYHFLFLRFNFWLKMECTTFSSVVLWILLTEIFTQPSLSDRIEFFYLIPQKVSWNTAVIVSSKHTGYGAISSSYFAITLCWQRKRNEQQQALLFNSVF